MTVQEYVDKINTRYRSGITTEHSFRGDLQNLLESWLPEVQVTNEPTRIKCGAPDYILTRRDIPVGYIEAKDLGADLTSKIYLEQFNRYREALPNLVITNYLDFHFYKEGALVTTHSVGKVNGNAVVPIQAAAEPFKALITDFSTVVAQTIRSSQKLAVMMANKAKLLAGVIGEALASDEANDANSTLKDQYHAFKEILIHEITTKEFADIYSQTIAYGMFAARLHDPTLPTFTRIEAAELIPKSNPFLRKLFQYIAGYDLDTRIVWIVDALADIFRATDVAALLKNFGKATQQHDPIIHFYETFLAEYDPKLRKARGVWYTPEPVVKFMVRAVDDILKTEFNLRDGLADTSKTKVKTKVYTKATADQRSKIKETEIEKEVHKVQILDPATGTGTFLAEVVKYIYNSKFQGQQGIWSSYVETHLLPRINGFELLMASYAMAHLKLDLLLTETGYKPTTDQRLKVYLTNSLEEHHPDTGTLFANWLSTEANEANQIKRDVPVMVVIGNPPYSVSSTNKSQWIQHLIRDYKVGLKERKINLDDDYIKFLRFGQFFVDKNGEGILAYISNNSFIDGLTHRQMRYSLLKSFDKIFIIDLHGNANKKEASPDGSLDQNVFDIRQGVSINLFIRTKKKVDNERGSVFHFDLYGKREVKYDFLNTTNFTEIPWVSVAAEEPSNFFVPQNTKLSSNYKQGFSLTELFIHFNSGIQTKRDKFTLHFSSGELLEVVEYLKNHTPEETRKRYDLAPDGRDWQTQLAKADILKGFNIVKILYRPFDERYTAYTGNSKGFLAYPRHQTSSNLIDKENICLISCRQTKSNPGIFISVNPIDQKIFSAYDINTMFPLYLYSDSQVAQALAIDSKRMLNLNMETISTISSSLGIPFSEDGSTSESTFTPMDIVDYVYAVLNSRFYKEKYNEFLETDFPRVPYPKDDIWFWKLVRLGRELRQLHLMESAQLDQFSTNYPIDGTNVIEAVKYDGDRVWINSLQYFTGVPESAWTFFIGGYQPAQKWLKDRKGRQLSFDDILHYQRMIVALVETDRLMKEIDSINWHH